MLPKAANLSILENTFSSIIYSQALRLKRICSEEKDLMAELTNLNGYFTNRGYEHKLIADNINKAINHKDTQKKTQGHTYNDDSDLPPTESTIL